jgi:hypothetical protein
VAITKITAATEKEVVARSFGHFFASNKSLLPLMTRLIDYEVMMCGGNDLKNGIKWLFKAENTLFRNNSLAVAVFQNYAKMFGLSYLWRTFGRIQTLFYLSLTIPAFLAELEVLTNQNKKKKSDVDQHFMYLFTPNRVLPFQELLNQVCWMIHWN